VALRLEQLEKLEGGNMKTNEEGRLDAINTGRSAGTGKKSKFHLPGQIHMSQAHSFRKEKMAVCM
jgi:hypothetical protein